MTMRLVRSRKFFHNVSLSLIVIILAGYYESQTFENVSSFTCAYAFATYVSQQGRQEQRVNNILGKGAGNSILGHSRHRIFRGSPVSVRLSVTRANLESFQDSEEYNKPDPAVQRSNHNTKANQRYTNNTRSSELSKQSKPPYQLNSELLNLRQRRRRRGFNSRSNNGAQLAEERLEQAMQLQMELLPMITSEEERQDYCNTVFPNEKSFNIVIMAYAEQSGKGDRFAPKRAEQLLQKMKMFHRYVQPSVFTYNAVMEAWVKSLPSDSSRDNSGLRQRQHEQDYGRRRQKAKTKNSVLALFREIEQRGLKPNVYSFNLVLSAYARSSDENDLQQAENWLEKMNQDQAIELDRQTYNIIFTAYANHGKIDKALSLLRTLINQYTTRQQQGDDSPLKPDQVWFNCVLKACATYCALSSADANNNDQRDVATAAAATATETADWVLSKLKTLYQDGQTNLKPDIYVYNHVLNVHAQCGNAERAEVLLQELEDHYAKTQEPKMAPDRISYTTAIKAYANSPGQNSHHRAETLFLKMQTLAVSCPDRTRNIMPNTITYNIMIKIWASLRTREGLQRAAFLLRQMEQQQCSNPGVMIKPPPPSAVSYTELINGWSKSGLREAGYRAEKLLLELEQVPPNRQRGIKWTRIYNSVITSWAKSGNEVAPQRVESLLNMLERKCFSSSPRNRINTCPDKTTFLCIADTYAKTGIIDAEQRCDDLLLRMKRLREELVATTPTGPSDHPVPDLKPDRALYNSILNALAKSCQPSAERKSKEILTMMQTSPDPDLRPNIVTYSTFIDCNTKSSDEPDVKQAEELLRFVEGSYRNGDELLKPDAVFYSAILQAWAKTATEAGAEKAEKLLRQNEGLYEQGHDYAKPHRLMYNAVMDAVARTGLPGSGKRAAELLREMEMLYEAGDEEMKPTRRSFNAVMLAYRHDENGAEQAEKLLDRMETLADDDSGCFDQLKPDVVTYNCVMRAILSDGSSSSSRQNRDDDDEKNDASNRAQGLLDRMEQRNVRPDGTTYSCVIEAWLKRNDEIGSQMAEKLLQQFLKLVDDSPPPAVGAGVGTDEQLDLGDVLDLINSYSDKEN